MKPTFIIGKDLFGTWRDDLERGEPPTRFNLPSPFASIDLRPGRMILFGGPPASGKSAALVQIGIDLLRKNDSARLLLANVEMSPSLLLDRIVSRLAGVPIKQIADRSLASDERDRIRAAIDSLEPIADRLAFLNPPYSLEHAAAAGTEFGSNAIILDYIQRFAVGDDGSQREQLENAISIVRRFCDEGAVVLIAAAVARQKNSGGSTYSGLNLASFRGSSELEFGCDAAYLLIADDAGGVEFRCEKNRYGSVEHMATTFDGATQTFGESVEHSGFAAFDDAKPTRKAGSRPKGRKT